jgi:Cu/Ag efflux pump CusA
MTVAVFIAALLPVVWGSGTGSEIMRRIAAPMAGVDHDFSAERERHINN